MIGAYFYANEIRLCVGVLLQGEDFGWLGNALVAVGRACGFKQSLSPAERQQLRNKADSPAVVSRTAEEAVGELLDIDGRTARCGCAVDGHRQQLSFRRDTRRRGFPLGRWRGNVGYKEQRFNGDGHSRARDQSWWRHFCRDLQRHLQVDRQRRELERGQQWTRLSIYYFTCD